MSKISGGFCRFCLASVPFHPFGRALVWVCGCVCPACSVPFGSLERGVSTVLLDELAVADEEDDSGECFDGFVQW